MPSALYFPHTTIRSESLLREGLLLWDRVTTIVPFPGWQPEFDLPKPYVQAQELLIAPRAPSNEEKQAVHAAIESLVDQGLPKWLVDSTTLPAHIDLTEPYGIYRAWRC